MLTLTLTLTSYLSLTYQTALKELETLKIVSFVGNFEDATKGYISVTENASGKVFFETWENFVNEHPLMKKISVYEWEEVFDDDFLDDAQWIKKHRNSKLFDIFEDKSNSFQMLKNKMKQIK
jgi:hypothetical protein